MVEVDLKPCPFCGGPAVVVEGGFTFYVTCRDADCFVALGENYDSSAFPDHRFPDPFIATKAWNRRTPSPEAKP